MGKVAVAETKKRKKKGRPSLLDLKKRALEQQQQQPLTNTSSPNFNTPKIRSTRRNPNSAGFSPSPPQFIEAADDDDERKEKKVKLVVRLPQSNQHSQSSPRSSSLNSASCGSDSNADAAENNHEASLNKRKINAVSDLSDDLVTDQGEKNLKATDSLHGSTQRSPLESGPTTPLPSKKLLVFILDRLQKKDTHGVFSEPVDPDELPDYHDIIEHPMDFGTVRKKLDNGLYSNLEQLEADVLLICSNAMQYNSPNTVFFRQARSIQELAKRDFENLRQEGEDGELQPKVVRRGRPPTKHLKKSLGGSPVDRVGPELSSGATLATGEDNSNGSNAYNLRRGPAVHRLQSADASITSHRSRNGENYSELLSNWNDEFPASILKADMKYGNKQFSLDETRRDTYKEFHPSSTGPEPCALYSLGGDMKQLMSVGLHSEHGYARSLARFAANLGPVVWKVASKKFSSVLPPGVKFGPGLLGENASQSQTHHRNGFKGVFGYNLSPQPGMVGLATPTGQLGLEETSVPSQMLRMVPRTDTTSSHLTNKNHMDSEEPHLSESSSKQNSGNLVAKDTGPGLSTVADFRQVLSPHIRQYGLAVPPDLNVRIQAPGSPSSGLRIGSPQQQQQPDLALQL